MTMYERPWGKVEQQRTFGLPQRRQPMIDFSGAYPVLIRKPQPPSDVRQFNGAEYIGKLNVFKNGKWSQLKGHTAIIMYGKDGVSHCRAQFDDLDLPENLTHGWTVYPITDFFIHVTNRS